MALDTEAKGIILSAAPQGEYGRRLTILTDRFGKICVFAGSAAKAGSHLTGLTRPMICASFTLSRGRNAYNLHGARLIHGFPGLMTDFEASCYGLYFLELLDTNPFFFYKNQLIVHRSNEHLQPILIL